MPASLYAPLDNKLINQRDRRGAPDDVIAADNLAMTSWPIFYIHESVKAFISLGEQRIDRWTESMSSAFVGGGYRSGLRVGKVQRAFRRPSVGFEPATSGVSQFQVLRDWPRAAVHRAGSEGSRSRPVKLVGLQGTRECRGLASSSSSSSPPGDQQSAARGARRRQKAGF